MSSPRPPRVTIGVPAYNAERFLAVALESLVNQTYRDIEILVVDNASTDSTGDIVREFAERDDRIRYVRNEQNIGAGRNFIRCVDLARTELFRWQSADDYSAPTFVERCVEVLDAHPDVIQAYPRAILVDENGAELERYDEKISTVAESPRVRYLHVMRNIALVNALYGVMRTELLRKTGIHGAYLGADVIVQEEIALYGKIWEIPEWLYFRRMHAAAHSAMSVAEKNAFFNPGKPRRRELTMWRHLRERIIAMLRSPLPLGEKTRLAGVILRSGVSGRDELVRELVDGVRYRLSRPASP